MTGRTGDHQPGSSDQPCEGATHVVGHSGWMDGVGPFGPTVALAVAGAASPGVYTPVETSTTRSTSSEARGHRRRARRSTSSSASPAGLASADQRDDG